MHSPEIRRRALALHAEGRLPGAIGQTLGVSRAAVREWIADPERALAQRSVGRCFVCASQPCSEPTAYAYLLGQYLGDGYLVTRARVPRLRIACADSYPGIAAEVDEAMRTISGNRVCVVAATGCSDHVCYWNHWPCLFPQHGPGRKHERTIRLAAWQQSIVAAHPWPLIRGLIHSDGCRSVNRVRTRGREYAYPRYFFANESADIRAVLTDALDRVGIAWRPNRPNSISIARRADVRSIDAHVGPKT